MNGGCGRADDPFYPRLKGRVISTTGMAFYEDRDEELARILGERFAARGVADCASYLDLLDADRDEFDALISELTIGETYFFRYKEQFDALRDIVLPDIIERNAKSKRLSVWSAGCSNGAEPYSLAIMLRQNFGVEIDGWNVSIVGTDINRKFLARASEGVFDEWSLRGMPDAKRESYFARVGKRWRIAPEYRGWVSFQYHNLVDDPFPSLLHNLYSFDLILCRNVVIYFTAETFARLLSQFHESLNPQGWLVVGHSEPNTELFRAFRTVDAPGAVLYQKAPPRPLREVPAPPPPPPGPPPLPKLAPPLPLPPLAPEPKPALPVAEPPAPGAALSEIRRQADQGRWAEAARLCRDLTQREPLNAAAHLYLALVLEQRNEIGPAEEALRRAIYIDRAVPMAHYHLGLMQQRRGDFAGARRSFRNALKLLDALPADHALPCADGVTAGELAGLAQMQLNVMGAA